MPNEEQATAWTEVVGPVWLANEANLDRASRPLGIAAIDAARPIEGEAVLDVGCGTGPTTIELAKRVGPHGRVLGLDISPLLIGRARERAPQENAGNVEFVVGDAQTHPLKPEFDLVFSRFGVMFFDDPTAAFTNLRRALKPGGRLTFVCWQNVFENVWMSLPTMAASSVLGDFDLPPEGTPGPFAFADPDRVREIVGNTGFSDVNVDDFRTTMDSSENDVDERLTMTVRMGPLAQKFAEADAATQRRVLDAVRGAAAPHLSDGVYRVPAAAWIVSARSE